MANVTAGSPELLTALRTRAHGESTTIHLIVPATPFGGGRASAIQTLERALAHLRDAGLEADGAVANADPIVAVTDAWDPRRYDEIIVSTLPIGVSKWLRAGLPQRIERLTGAPVTHVVSQPPQPERQTEPAPAREDRGILMGPLSVLGWGNGTSQGRDPAGPRGTSSARPKTSS